MNLINQLFFAVLMSSVTSTLLVVVWWMLRGFFMLVNAKLIYITLRCICIMYLLPVGYIAVLFTYREWFQGNSQIWKLVFARSKQLTGKLQIYAFGWVVVAVAVCIFFIANYLYWKCKLADNILEDDKVRLRIFRKACKKLNIKEGKMTLYRNPVVSGPLIIGFLHPQIILPEQDYSAEDLEIILYHELSHHIHGDLNFKVMAAVVIVFHFFNPVVYLLFILIDIWCECMADITAMEASGIVFSGNAYYKRLMKLVPEEDKSEANGPLISTLGSTKKVLTRRIDFMRKYQKAKSAGKVITALFTGVFILISGTTAYASGKTIADLHTIVYQNTEVRTNETEPKIVGKAVGTGEDGLVEYHCSVDDLDKENLQIIYDPTDEAAAIAEGQYYYFDWIVNPNTRHVSGEYRVTAGSTFHTAVTCTPGNKRYWLGIMDDDGSAWYVEGTGSTAHDFRITTTNKYRVFVQNNYTDGTVLRAVGYYMYD